MARTLRTKSETGIYHVMMRGVNHQIIFEQPSDYSRFQELLGQFTNPKDEMNHPFVTEGRFFCYIFTLCQSLIWWVLALLPLLEAIHVHFPRDILARYQLH